MTNWQLITLIGLIASQSSCTTTQAINYQTRDSMGQHQTTHSIENEHRRSSNEFFRHNTKRINTDEW